ncbi:MAG TPA: hypothetical protein VFA02_11460 [Pseudacidobacterium sp.]|nr:hypothetical protein [Pseudacidobacterium sp.]
MKDRRKTEPHDLEEHASTKYRPPTGVQPAPAPVEPEDAYLTGASRSLQRRLLGLNIENGQAQRHPDTPAGIHSTGSFTGKAKKS